MSPVSRGRKSRRKSKHRDQSGRPGQSLPGPLPLLGPRRRPDWFDPAIKTVLEGANTTVAAGGPRELEQATAELIGAELHATLQARHGGFWFDWWLAELIEAALTRIRTRDEWVAPWRLLHGLTAITSPALCSAAQTALSRGRKDLRGDAALREQPAWLNTLRRIEATGEVWELCDAYGARFALVAGYRYAGGRDPSVFLFDVDACGILRLAHAGVFDGVDQAAAEWRTLVGDAAAGALPRPVEDPERLACLVHCEPGDVIDGGESRALMDNWFRASRRIHDLAEALRRRGTPIPALGSLYHGLDPAPMVAEFTGWYASRHGSQPDSDAVTAMAEEWMEGALPDTWHAVSPHRIEFQRALIDDWIPDDPITIAVKSLLPEWVRWHGEQSGLAADLLDRSITIAQGGQRAPSDCPGGLPY